MMQVSDYLAHVAPHLESREQSHLAVDSTHLAGPLSGSPREGCVGERKGLRSNSHSPESAGKVE